MKWLAMIVAGLASLAGVWWKWRSSHDPDQLRKQIRRQVAAIEAMDLDLQDCLARHDAHDFMGLREEYLQACQTLNRLRARLPEGDPDRR
jgi:hypothetical protein